MKILSEMINSLITSGGLGFINLFILTRLEKINIDEEDKEDKVIFLIFFSIVNYVLFLSFGELFKKISLFSDFRVPLSIIFVLIISIILSFTLFASIATYMNNIINRSRHNERLSSFDNRSIKKIAFNFDTNKTIFIFSFDNKLIFSGVSGWFSDLDNVDFELIAYPFNEKTTLDSYDKVMDFITTKSVESEIYINLDKKIKIITIY